MKKELVEVIEGKFNQYQDALVLQQADLSLKSISDMVSSEAIDISPKYQRRKRWDTDKESGLIESFILNIPVPPIYLAEDSYGTYSVIDGKQRITAINNFLEGKIKLQNLERFTELEGCSFEDLPRSITNALKIRPYLRVVTLLKQSDGELKHEVFLRLNKAGVALNAQEIRNVAFRGHLNDLLFELSEKESFSKVLKANKNSKTYREMIDVQFVLRYFTVLHSWQNFPGNMDVAMDRFMRENYTASAEDVDNYRSSFNRAFNACLDIWGEDAFLKPNSNRRVLKGVYEVQMVCLGLLTDAQLKKVIENKERVKELLINEFEINENFEKSVTQFTSNSKNMMYRISTFLNLLKKI